MAKKDTEHSKNFEKVKTYYLNYLEGVTPSWDLAKVHAAVGKWITEEEFKEITGEDYK